MARQFHRTTAQLLFICKRARPDVETLVLFYKCLRFDLEEMGFVVNPYDPCVANMMVNGAQITVCWHVDDLKISHRDEEVVSAFAIQIA